MNLSEAQIESLAPNPAAYSAGKKLSAKEQWVSYAGNERVIWGSIKGSGKSPYLTQIDKAAVAYKCTCPSRQFPCKHSIGLLLLHAQHNSSFEKSDEPEWVKEWMDKRVAKEQQKKEEPPERTSEEQEQLEKNKEKTQANRLTSVMAGVAELELWLKDMVRIGFLELPNKSKSEFDKVAARMVDAKAPGLAGWVRAYTRLNYGNALEWQQEAMSITARLFLLVRTLKNYEQLNPLWQHTVRNLSGWSQSTKELLADADAEVVTDQWLVVGQETETSDDEITIQRNWLLGFTTGRTALILNFGTKFSALENNVLPGTFIDADLAFFPSVLPQRAAVKMQRKLLTMLSPIPVAISSWTEALHYRTAQLKINPWANDIILLLSNARLIKSDDHWVVCDEHKFSVPIITEFDFQKIMKWVALTGNRSSPMAVVMRDNKVIPLGIVDEQVYKLL